MNNKVFALAAALLAGAMFARADMITVTPLQVGGFFAGGGADNKIEHQNYFVGYGTVGGTRTDERRSFFWYHIPGFSGEVVDVTIKLKMAATTSLIFGLADDPSMHDTVETFQLGATPITPLHLVDPSLTLADGKAIFDALDDHPVASPYDFVKGSIPDFPFAVEIHLDDAGKSLVSSHRGGDAVFTGWMPSWSYDDRKDDHGKYLEADELLFGLSDIPTGVPPPDLTIEYKPVPEPATLAVVGLGFAAFMRGRLGRRTQARARTAEGWERLRRGPFR